MTKCACGVMFIDFQLNAENNHLCFSCRASKGRDGMLEYTVLCWSCGEFYPKAGLEHVCKGVRVYS